MKLLSFRQALVILLTNLGFVFLFLMQGTQVEQLAYAMGILIFATVSLGIASNIPHD